MDCKSIGRTIAALRKKSGMTQLELAGMLDVTDKAVSRWENGQSYPDVTLFPQIASVFGVTVDYLMQGKRKGIAIAGNILLDIVKNIEQYPRMGMLAQITDVSYAVGGCVPNVAIDLSRIDPTLPVSAIGMVGTDENGRFILSQLQKNGINVSKIAFSKQAPTGFSDVMSVPSGERTFFHQRGANAEFSPEDVDLASLNCDLLHIGYILLLDRFDEPDPQYGTVMARFLKGVRQAGIKTSVDMVSSSSADYGAMLIPCLPYCNYVIINEIECCGAWGLDARNPDGSLNRENIYEAMRRTVEAGVQDRVIVHSKERGFMMGRDLQPVEVASLRIPKEEIKGSVGAGDAFCAGCLYGIYNGFSDRQTLEFASAAAACNLFAANSVDGMRSKNEILQIAEQYERRTE